MTKINYKEPEIFEIEKIRGEINKNIQFMEERELNEKITSINVILNDLKAQKESRRHKKTIR